MKIVEYQIITAGQDEVVVEMVNEAITEGWQPFGAPLGGKGWTSQAMVKYDADGG